VTESSAECSPPAAVCLRRLAALHRRLALLPPTVRTRRHYCPQIAYHNNKLEEVSQHSVRMPKQATIADLLEEVRAGSGAHCAEG